MGLVAYLIDATAAGGITMAMALTGGPAKQFEWGGITFNPTKDGEPEWQKTKVNYEKNPSPNGNSYSEGEATVGFFQQDCAMTPEEFSEFEDLQDGEDRSGTVTFLNGDVLTLDCSIDVEHLLTSGKVTVKLAGDVNLQ